MCCICTHAHTHTHTHKHIHTYTTPQIKDDEEEHRIRFEEENFVRLTVSKKERRRIREVSFNIHAHLFVCRHA